MKPEKHITVDLGRSLPAVLKDFDEVWVDKETATIFAKHENKKYHIEMADYLLQTSKEIQELRRVFEEGILDLARDLVEKYPSDYTDYKAKEDILMRLKNKDLDQARRIIQSRTTRSL